MTLNILRLRRKAAFRYPIEPAPRTAVLVPWFYPGILPAKAAVRIFAEGWSAEAAAFAPGAIAAPLEQLLELAANAPPLTHALIVLRREGSPVLSIDDRERLWRAFRVPVFEQIVGPRGELLAAECEAHDGLHIEMPGLRWDGYMMDLALCACGRKTPRLSPTEPLERSRSVAGYAR